MSEEYLPPSERSPALLTFKGEPRTPSKLAELTKWQRFCRWAMPWLSAKAEMGEEFLAVELRKRKAEAAKLEAEARSLDAKSLKDFADARKTYQESVEIAERTDVARAKCPPPADAKVIDMEFEKLKEDLLEKLETARLLHGTCIVSITEGKPEVAALDASTPALVIRKISERTVQLSPSGAVIEASANLSTNEPSSLEPPKTP